jgi:hypothetical protein
VSDVFGRPLNLQSTQGHVNKTPLAPTGTDPSDQDEPFSGIRGPGEPSAPGVGSAFQQEMVGSSGGIRASQPQSRGGGDPTTAPTTWSGSPGGVPMPAAVPRPETPPETLGGEDAFANLR